MASSSNQERSATEVIRLVSDYDNQIRRAVEVGMESIRETIRRMGKGLTTIFPIQQYVLDRLPPRVFLFVFIMAWKIKSNRDTPGFLEQLRAELYNIDPIPQPTSPIPTPLVRASVPPPIDQVAVDTSLVLPAHAPTVPAITTLSPAMPYTLTSAAPTAVTFYPAGFKTGPPKATAAKPAVSKPAKPAISKPAASKPAVAERANTKTKSHSEIIAQNLEKARQKFWSFADDAEESAEDNWQSNDHTELDPEQPYEDDEQSAEDNHRQQPADGLGSGRNKHRRRRKPVKEDDYNDPPCARCIRGKLMCNKEVGGGACYMCVVKKSRCMYSKSGHKDALDREDRDVKEIEGKGKGKTKTRSQRKGKDVELVEVDGPEVKGSKSSVRLWDIFDDEDHNLKQPASDMKPTHGQLLSPELQGTLNGVQSQLRELTGKIRDNCDTCETTSGRLKNMDSEISQLKKLLSEVLRRLPEKEPSDASDDEMNVDDNAAPAPVDAVRINSQSPPAVAVPDVHIAVPAIANFIPAASTLSMAGVSATSLATPSPPSIANHANITPAKAAPAMALTPSSAALNSVEGFKFFDPATDNLDLTPSPQASSGSVVEDFTYPDTIDLDFTPPPQASSGSVVEDLNPWPDTIDLDFTPPPQASSLANFVIDAFNPATDTFNLTPSPQASSGSHSLQVKPSSEVCTKSQSILPYFVTGGKRKANNTSAARAPKRRK